MIRSAVVDMGLILAKHMLHEDKMGMWFKQARLLPEEIRFLRDCMKRAPGTKDWYSICVREEEK